MDILSKSEDKVSVKLYVSTREWLRSQKRHVENEAGWTPDYADLVEYFLEQFRILTGKTSSANKSAAVQVAASPIAQRAVKISRQSPRAARLLATVLDALEAEFGAGDSGDNGDTVKNQQDIDSVLSPITWGQLGTVALPVSPRVPNRSGTRRSR